MYSTPKTFGPVLLQSAHEGKKLSPFYLTLYLTSSPSVAALEWEALGKVTRQKATEGSPGDTLHQLNPQNLENRVRPCVSVCVCVLGEVTQSTG